MSKSEDQPDQANLSEFQTAADIVDDGYERPNWNPMADDETDTGTRTRCGNCDKTVSQQFARVFGDNENTIFGCPSCRSYRELKDGAVRDGDSA